MHLAQISLTFIVMQKVYLLRVVMYFLIHIEYATLHVAKGCIDAYKSVEPWKSFKTIVEDGGTSINIIENSAFKEPFNVYDLNGRKVLTHVTSLDGLPNGVYIINDKKVIMK